MAKKRASRTSSYNPLDDIKETRRGTKQRIAEERAASAKRLETQRAQEHRTRMQEQQRFVENKWQNYRSAGQGSKTYNQWRQAAENAAARDFQTQIGKRKIDIVRTPDKLSGRTAEFGTRSLLEGMKSWMRGGGLRRGSM